MMETTAEQVLTLCRHDLGAFCRFGFTTLNPHLEYFHNFHIDLINDALSKVASGEIKRLVINLPPRYGKSHCASISFPAWVLGRNPCLKILCVSGSYDLSSSLENQFCELVYSPRYKSVFPSVSFNGESKNIVTQHGGYRKSATIDSSLTGVGADIIIIDDPISPQDANIEPSRDYVNQMFDQNICQRLNDKKEGSIILVMQRLHENDLSGHILKKEMGYHQLNLPAFATDYEKWELSNGRVITRNKWEPLHPERESYEDLLKIRYSIGGEAFAAQYLQYQMKPQYGAVVVPKQYRDFEHWKKDDPNGVKERVFLLDSGLLVVPEQLTMEEAVIEGQILREKLKNLPDL